MNNPHTGEPYDSSSQAPGFGSPDVAPVQPDPIYQPLPTYQDNPYAAGYQTPYQQPGYEVQAYPQDGYQQKGYPQPVSSQPQQFPQGGYGYQPPYAYPAPTNGLAIASLVVSIISMAGLCAYGLGGYLGIVGLIMGVVSRRQIREQGGDGDGLALAGIIIGSIATAIAVIATILIVVTIVSVANAQP